MMLQQHKGWCIIYVEWSYDDFEGGSRFFSSRFFSRGGWVEEALETFPKVIQGMREAMEKFQFVRHLTNLCTTVLYTVVCIFL